MLKRRKDDGFTLIELMIVIAVIGILAVVLVPKMTGLKSSAKAVGVQTNVKSVQAYVVANISRWINLNYTEPDLEIAKRIFENFGPTESSFSNPFSQLNTMSVDDAISAAALPRDLNGNGVTTDTGEATAIAITQATTDALQILSAPPTGADIPKGAVVVTLPATNALLVSTGIVVTGYDENGNVVNTFTIKE